MGVASSSESSASGGATANTNTNIEDNTNCYFGFSSQEIDHLSTLRRLVLQESSNNTTTGQDFLMIIWQCSHLLSLNNTPSSLDSISEFEAHLMRSSPSQLELVQKRCQWLTELLPTFTTLRKMNSTLEVLFNSDDFVQQVSQMLVHDNQSATLNFLFSILSSEESSISATDMINFCFEMASLSHYILQNYTNAPTIEILEGINTSSENDMIQSLTNSLCEYARSSCNNQHDFGGYQTTATVSSSATTSSIPEGNVTKREFSEWQRKTVPDLLSCSVSKFLHVLFFSPEGTQSNNQKPFPSIRSCKEITSQTTTKLKEGEILPISSHVFGSNNTPHLSPQIFAFASISKHKFGEKWYRIFAGEDDGWTFQSLERAILGYEGPTLLVVQGHSKIDNKNKSVTFGAYTATKWQNKRDFFGSSDCFLYQLQPTLTVLKPLPKMGTRGGHYMYFHSNTNVSTTNPSRKDLAVGLGFGGSVRHPRLFIDNQLEEASVSHQDTSFEEGYIGLPPSNDPFCSQSFSSTVHIDSLEVYAVGDEETIRRGFQAQYQHRDIADATLRNARTVDKAAFLGDMRNGVIETKAFAHRGQVDGRANGHLKGEEDGKANGL